MSDELLTVEQAAERLQMHPDTVRRLLREGQLPGRKVGARQWRVSSASLTTHIEGGDQPPAMTVAVEPVATKSAEVCSARAKVKTATPSATKTTRTAGARKKPAVPKGD